MNNEYLERLHEQEMIIDTMPCGDERARISEILYKIKKELIVYEYLEKQAPNIRKRIEDLFEQL